MLAMLASASGQVPLPDPPTPFTPPFPSTNAFFVDVAFGPSDGLAYVWDGAQVLKQNGPNSAQFTPIGSVPSGNSADVGPISFSGDGTNLLLGNGAGGVLQGSFNGLIFGMPSTGASVSSPVGNAAFNTSFAALPATSDQYFVDEGVLVGTETFPSASSVSFFNSTTHADTTLIPNIPGNSASVVVHNGQLYVGIGFGPERGEIRSFALSTLENALSTSSTVPWTSGQLINSLDNNSGAGMFFDDRGFLFVGGGNGVTVFDTQGHSRVYLNGFTSLVYDSFDDRVLVTGDKVGIYPASAFVVPEPSTAMLATAAGAVLLAIALWRRNVRRERRHTTV